MEKMTREEIRNTIILDLEKAWENQNEIDYWLDKLPMAKDSDYDEGVHECIGHLKDSLYTKEYYEMAIDEIVEHYYINQEEYDFS